MTTVEVMEEIKEIVASQFWCGPADIAPSMTFDSIDADSLDLIEIVMTIEDRFFIEIPDEMVPNEGRTTVGELAELVGRLHGVA